MRWNGVVKFEEIADGFQFQGPSTRRRNTFPLASSAWYFNPSRRRIPLLYHQTHQVRTSVQLIFQPIDTPLRSPFVQRFFVQLYLSFFLSFTKLASIPITKMNIMENAVSPTDNHHPSTEERKQSPPAFLDLADSVAYFYMFVKSSPAHIIYF
jgi:hypothetical protein